jgi:hypothetical protein
VRRGNGVLRVGACPARESCSCAPTPNSISSIRRRLPALIRKFHLAKLARAGDWAAIARDAARFDPIPADIQQAGIPPHPPVPPRVVLWGSGTPRREFLHVDNMAAACVHVGLRTDSTAPVKIGLGADVTIRESPSASWPSRSPG